LRETEKHLHRTKNSPHLPSGGSVSRVLYVTSDQKVTSQTTRCRLDVLAIAVSPATEAASPATVETAPHTREHHGEISHRNYRVIIVDHTGQ